MKKHGVQKVCFALLMVSTVTLAGCGAFRTDYVPPAVQVPTGWQQGRPGENASAAPWWKDFGDENLNSLVDNVLAKNNDLAAAAIRLRRAQLQAGLAADQINNPRVSAGSNASIDQNFNSGNSSKRFSVNGSISYEADLWGRLDSAKDAADFEANATAEDLESVKLSLIGTTLNLYWTAAYLNEQRALAEQSIAYAQKTFDIINSQYAAGSVSSLETKEAAQSVNAQKAALTQIKQQQVENKNAMALLLDSAPGIDVADPKTLPANALPPVAAGIPASALAARPDIRAAEWRLKSTLSNVDSVKMSYFPVLSLTADLGSSSPQLRNIVSNPIGSLGAGLALPFLQWNEMQLNIKVSKTQYDEAVVNYRQTLYTALSDVENALSNREQLAVAGGILETSLSQARDVERLYEIRYNSGAVDVKTWLDAQEKRRQAENALAQNRLNRLQNHVTLYMALGGKPETASVQ